MAKVCFYCGKGPITGNTLTRRGLLKKKGGTGSKTMRSTKRVFLPNLQKIRTLISGKIRRIYICTKCLKSNKVNKYIPQKSATLTNP